VANERLALAIPTFNRPEILRQNLETMLPELQAHNIPVYISDDSTTDDTQHLIETLQERYPRIHYTHNRPGLGHDRNCMATLGLPDADYIWYLGDSLLILPGVLVSVLGVLEADYDFVFLNSRIKGAADFSVIPRSSVTPFFEKYAWHLTLTGVTIYSRKFQEWMRANTHPRMYQNFQQLGMVLEYVYCKPKVFTQAFWFQQLAIAHTTQKKKSYWVNHSLSVFAQDWVALLDAFSDVMGSRTCEAIIRSHDLNTKVFRLGKLIGLRSLDLLNAAILESHGPSLLRACQLSPRLVRLVAALPLPLARAYSKPWWRKQK